MTILTLEEMREIRRNRRVALSNFATALGVDPRTVRSMSVVDGSIRLSLFPENNTGRFDGHTVTDYQGNQAKATYEVNLLFTETDLDADEANAKEAAKVFGDAKGAFGQDL